MFKKHYAFGRNDVLSTFAKTGNIAHKNDLASRKKKLNTTANFLLHVSEQGVFYFPNVCQVIAKKKSNVSKKIPFPLKLISIGSQGFSQTRRSNFT